MKKYLSHIAAVLAGGAVMFGGTELTTPVTEPITLDAQKQQITKMYIDAKVRLNEVPDLDLSVTTPEEMSAAYTELAIEKDAFVIVDPLSTIQLFDTLHDKAVQDGVACK